MANQTVKSIGDYIREQREQAKISMRQLAQQAGVSNPYLSQIERGLRKPSADILQQLAKGLRISAEALYVLAGPELSERQKQVLIEIYESFRKENAAEAEVAQAAAEAAAETKASKSSWSDATAEAEQDESPWSDATVEAEQDERFYDADDVSGQTIPSD